MLSKNKHQWILLVLHNNILKNFRKKQNFIIKIKIIKIIKFLKIIYFI